MDLNKKPVVEISAGDAKRLGIKNDDRVEIFNAHSGFKLWARVTETLRPGILALDHGWWDRYLAEAGHYHSVTVQEKIKPTHEIYYLPAVHAPGQLWKDTRADIRKAPA